VLTSTSYAELISNRAFQGDEFTPSTLKPWSAFGPASISLHNATTPLSKALPTSVKVEGGAAGDEIGISNPGWWGIDVKKQTYKGTFWVLGEYEGDFTAALRSNTSGEVYASASVLSRSTDAEWTKHDFEIVSDVDAGFHVNFTVTYTPKSDNHVLHFGFISLFPPTWNDRENGMRIDLMQALKDLNPSFLRIPGGNNVQGHRAGSQWRWNETLGDLIDRPGRTGAWKYFNTDGMGLIEYFLVRNYNQVPPADVSRVY
jgi:alpha-N-arabinofuranosidase